MKQTIIIILIFVLSSVVLVTGFTKDKSHTPKNVYQVYLDGKKIGLINSKTELEDYIDKEQTTLKKKYGVNKVYAPKGVEIKKHITYDNNISTSKEIYEKIKDISPFTIKAWVITFKGEETKSINVINKKIFDGALEKTISAFIEIDDYKAYLNDSQKEIKETGTIIESIGLGNDPTYKEDHVSSNEKIFVDENELTRYLLFGTTEKQATYTVAVGDTIESVSEKHQLNTDEFLVANTQFTNANNLLYPGQEVVIGLINPQIKLEVVNHSIVNRTSDFKTDIVYDNNLTIGTSYEKQAGENGLVRVTEKTKYINGEFQEVAVVSREELKPAVNRIVVRGGKSVASVGDNSYWAWPTKTPYIISTYFTWRWGKFHEAIDITGTGYGSPIYAANNGTVAETGYDSTCGNKIYLNHNNGYYTIYCHLSAIYVNTGQVIERGSVIGAMGSTGYSTGTHLHFGLFLGYPYRGGTPANPLSLYRR